MQKTKRLNSKKPTKLGGEIWCSRIISSSYSTSRSHQILNTPFGLCVLIKLVSDPFCILDQIK